MSGWRLHIVAATVAAACLCADRAAASASGYVYVAVPAEACAQASPCAAPQVLVLDAATAAVVTSINLPMHTTPQGMAISADGRHLYVSNAGTEFSAATSMTVIDARHHMVERTVGLLPWQSGRLAVRGDDSQVFVLTMRSPGGLYAFETRIFSISEVVSVPPTSVNLVASAPLDRVFVVFGDPRQLDTGEIRAYGAGSLSVLGQTSGFLARDLSISRDGLRLFDVATNSSRPSNGTFGSVIDAATLNAVYNYEFGSPARPPLDLNVEEILTVGVAGFTRLNPVTGAGTTTPLTGLTNFPAMTLARSGARLFALHVANETSGNLIAVIDVGAARVSSTIPLTAAATIITSTPDGAASCSYRLDSASVSLGANGPSFTAMSQKPDRVQLASDCAWTVTANVSWLTPSVVSGTGNATIVFTASPNPSADVRTASVSVGGQLVTVTQAGRGSQPPFGVVDTPADGATASGAVAVTGWALDDVGVARVDIYRDRVSTDPCCSALVLLASDVPLVAGARPDVAAAYPNLPFATRGGWGYQLLTNVLPGGDGPRRIYAYAVDVDDHASRLGSRLINVNNAIAAVPFGAIDTPGQGETVSGIITNWAWALAPQPASIATDGSTIDVVIDGTVVGHPTYGFDRSDIAGLFPGYANTHSAVGYFTIDTTALINGVHTIAWVVRDSLGRAQGIGSRYFTVQNP